MSPLFLFGCWLASILFVLSIFLQKSIFKRHYNLPPGHTGWPIIGESLSYLADPGVFIRQRMAKYKTNIFLTSFFSHKVVFVGGPAANKFLFSNEGKLVKWWIPESFGKLLSLPNYPENSDLQTSWLLLDESIHKFFKLDSIRNQTPLIDSMSREYIESSWVPEMGKEVNVYNTVKKFTLKLACRVVVDHSDSYPEKITKLSEQFLLLAEEGIFTGVNLPINLPGTPYYRSRKCGDKLRELVTEMVKQRRKETLPTSPADDLLGYLLQAKHPKTGHYFPEEQIVSKIIPYVFAGFYTSTSVNTCILSHLARHPDIYEKVRQEQLEVAKSKGEGELMNWEDIHHKMPYSWNVVRESMRLLPPEAATFRVALTDITFEGYNIPKGTKIGWATNYTHTDPKYFKDPEKFDPTRFEDMDGIPPYVYIPWGGGPRMCKGYEFARLSLLTFLHHVVTRFRLELVNPNEKTTGGIPSSMCLLQI